MAAFAVVVTTKEATELWRHQNNKDGTALICRLGWRIILSLKRFENHALDHRRHSSLNNHCFRVCESIS